jgi:inhibitor of KinA sporulation pathway (predicted exonuclease)
MKKATYKITVVNNGSYTTYELESKKAKDKWLYEYLTYQERLWAWEQWGNSDYKTFDKWFKEFIKPQWKESELQSLRINKKLILIKKQEK